MSDNPFITPENPLGRWDLPYAAVPAGPDVDVWSMICDSLSVTAAVTDTPLGRLPVLVLDFGSSLRPADAQPPRITFLASIDGLRAMRKLISAACNGAIRAAGGEA